MKIKKYYFKVESSQITARHKKRKHNDYHIYKEPCKIIDNQWQQKLKDQQWTGPNGNFVEILCFNLK